MSNFMSPRFKAIRSALRRLFPDGIPDWVVTLVNALPSSLTDEAIASIAAVILELAAEHKASLDYVIERLKLVLTLGGSISIESGAKPKPKPKLKK